MSNDTFCIFKYNGINPYPRTYKISSEINSMSEIPEYKNHYIIVSGDIYNIKDIKNEYSIESDILEEIIVELYLKVGLKISSYLDGIFAVLIINSEKIVMFRDFFSQGTIYFYFDTLKGEFIIANKIREIKKFLTLTVNSAVLAKYFVTASILLGDTFFKKINSLKFAEILEYSITESRLTSIHHDGLFYNIPVNNRQDDKTITLESEKIILKNLEGILNYYSNYIVINSLSGGVDSSYLQILLGKIGRNKAYTYSHQMIGTKVQQYSKDIAKYLGVDHKIIECKPEQILDNIKASISVCEAPYIFQGEFLQDHMFNVISNNEGNYTLLTSGSGADTSFGFGRPFIELIFFSNPLFLEVFKLFNAIILRYFYRLDYKRYKIIIQKLKSRTLDEEFLYVLFNRNKSDEEEIKKAFNLDNLYKIYAEDIKKIGKFDTDFVEKLQRYRLIEFEIYRENFVSNELCKEYGLKLCFPFLNKELIYYLGSIPIKKKIRFLTSKYFMRRMVLKYLPSKYINRKKISQGDKNFLYCFNDDKMPGLIQDIRNTKYDYFKFDYDKIFCDEKYYSLAIKLINFHIWHNMFIENVDVQDI
jgi:asparagine synthetase B (glutamine-hydrolysing)